MQWFSITTSLLNSDNLKLVIAQLYNEFQVCNFTIIADPKAGNGGMIRQELDF